MAFTAIEPHVLHAQSYVGAANTVIRFTKTSGENLLWHTVVPNTVICLSVSVCMFNDTFCLFLCQFAYDKEPEVNVTFYVKLKGTEKKIDSTLRGIFK